MLTSLGGALIGVVIIAMCILLHEAGHLLAAKRLGIPVDEFSIGFGKKLFSKKLGETEYNIRVFWLGGFVKPNQDSFKSAKRWKKIIVYLAGPSMNLLAVIITIAVLAFNNDHNLIDSLIIGVSFIRFVVHVTIDGISQYGVQALSSPVGAAYVASKMSTFESFAIFSAFIHASIGVMNLLPLPILDGGQVLINILRVPTETKVFKVVMVSCFVFFIAVGVGMIGLDVFRIFTNSFPGM